MLRTSNPAMKESVFTQLAGTATDRMTIGGTVNKTAILLLLAVLSAAWTWYSYTTGANVSGYMMIGAIGGFIIAMITIFKQSIAPVTAPIYAILEGLFLGGISAAFNKAYPGIAFSVFVVIIAALNLVLDFDLIETGERAGSPKYMEWYAAFALMITLVWLYLEILRLLVKLQSRK